MDAVEFLKTLSKMCNCECCNCAECLYINPCHIFGKKVPECAGHTCSECRRAFWLAEAEDV